MLEPKDLQKIREVVKDEIVTETDKLRREFKTQLTTELKPMKSDLAAIRREIKSVVAFFDSDYTELRSRVERIEEILNLKPLENTSN